MKTARVRAIAKKEVIQILRDPLSLITAFLMPVVLLFIFGYAITLDVNSLTTVVYDRDRSQLSRDLVSGLRESGYFVIVNQVEDAGAIDARLDKGTAQVAISIPEDFSENIKAGKRADLQAIVDGSDSNTATIAIGYLEAAIELYAKKISGSAPGSPAIEPRVRVWYNPELKSRNFIIPGLIAVIMMVIAALLTSLTVAREWERGTMEQLISTPVKPVELVTGKLIPYFIIGFIDMAASILLAVFLFGVPLKGSVLLLLALSSFFLLGGLSLGMLISIVAKSQLVASQVAMVATFLPAFLLSGFMFAIANMPPPLQAVTRVIPARYFVTILKGIFLKGSGPAVLAVEALFLMAFAAVIFTLAKKKLRKKIV